MMIQIKMIFAIIFTFFCLITASAASDSDERTFCPAAGGTTASSQTEAARSNHAAIGDVIKTCLDESQEAADIEKIIEDFKLDPRNKKFTEYLKGKALSKPSGQCLKFVKNGLVSSNLTEDRPEGRNARSAVDELKCHGFINILDYGSQRKIYQNHNESVLFNNEFDARKAPEGAVLVYSSNIPCKGSESQFLDCGHVEVPFETKKGDLGYVSDHISKNNEPITHKQSVQNSAEGRLLLALNKIKDRNLKSQAAVQEARYVLIGVMIPESKTNTRYKANIDKKIDCSK